MGYVAMPRGDVLEPLTPMDLRDPAPERHPRPNAEHPGPQELACLECVLPDCDPADARCRNPVARATRLHESQSAGRARKRRAALPEVFQRVGGGR